jgi:hypothetical protein
MRNMACWRRRFVKQLPRSFRQAGCASIVIRFEPEVEPLVLDVTNRLSSKIEYAPKQLAVTNLQLIVLFNLHRTAIHGQGLVSGKNGSMITAICIGVGVVGSRENEPDCAPVGKTAPRTIGTRSDLPEPTPPPNSEQAISMVQQWRLGGARLRREQKGAFSMTRRINEFAKIAAPQS